MCQVISVGLKASKSQPHRRAVFAGNVLTICQGKNSKDIASYHVAEIPGVPFPARGFELRKVAGGSDAEAESYAVCIDPSTGHTCECRGFLRHGACKHVDSVVELLDSGAFDPIDAPVIPFPSPEQVAEDAEHDFPECFRNLGPSTLPTDTPF